MLMRPSAYLEKLTKHLLGTKTQLRLINIKSVKECEDKNEKSEQVQISIVQHNIMYESEFCSSAAPNILACKRLLKVKHSLRVEIVKWVN